MRFISLALTTCALLLAAGLGGTVDLVVAQAPKPVEPAPAAKPAAKPAEPKKGAKPVKQSAVITMEKGGDIVIEFYPADAPKTVDNFVKLAKKGFYDGVTFHRREEGFRAAIPRATAPAAPATPSRRSSTSRSTSAVRWRWRGPRIPTRRAASSTSASLPPTSSTASTPSSAS